MIEIFVCFYEKGIEHFTIKMPHIPRKGDSIRFPMELIKDGSGEMPKQTVFKVKVVEWLIHLDNTVKAEIWLK